MPAKQPLKTTDRRRQVSPPKIQQYQRPGAYTSYLSAVFGRGEKYSGLGMFNDRRNV